MPRLLITGVTGLIGSSVLKAILAGKLDYKITALIRPGTVQERYSAFRTQLEVVKMDLADTERLKAFLDENIFDVIMHIGALRGGRKFSRTEYLSANFLSTQQFVEHCLKHDAKLLFCSSVGVFGAIPEELPANNATERNPDNFYHYTKIECEKVINQAVLKGLKAAILRPSITYGSRDRGFPFQLVKLVAQKRFPLINKRIWIHLCHIDTITHAFIWLLKNEFQPGLSLNVADREPVELADLVNFISREVHADSYHKGLHLDLVFFRWGEWLAKLVRNELWISRFQLISRSWFYHVTNTYELMDLPATFTIPGIKIVISDLLEQ
ncbi:MAG: NAD(P)-dependent oxidoreductase [Candidatus Syntrophosphaera sp.]|jgi:nucleoside-diphosphate-sugar epimerase